MSIYTSLGLLKDIDLPDDWDIAVPIFEVDDHLRISTWQPCEVKHPDEPHTVFIDPVSEETNKFLRDIYFELYQKGDFIKRYSHIKDSLNMEYSHQSVGIQLADYIAGSFGGFLRGFDISKTIFLNKIKKFLRTDSHGEVFGCGIREVPRNTLLRKQLKESLEI